jgi:hypothetical protein
VVSSQSFLIRWPAVGVVNGNQFGGQLPTVGMAGRLRPEWPIATLTCAVPLILVPLDYPSADNDADARGLQHATPMNGVLYLSPRKRFPERFYPNSRPLRYRSPSNALSRLSTTAASNARHLKNVEGLMRHDFMGKGGKEFSFQFNRYVRTKN